MNVVIVGANAALAGPLIERWEYRNYNITQVTRQVPFFPSGQPRPDVLVTMTGSTADGKLEGMESSKWDRVIADNLTAVASAFRSIGPHVRDGGNVVVVGSIIGSTGAYGAANYAAAKAGLVGLVRSAALEWASRGVCVNLLELGFIDAGMGARLPEKVKARVLPTIPLGRFETPEEFVHAVEYLSTVRYMTGGILTLAGGL